MSKKIGRITCFILLTLLLPYLLTKLFTRLSERSLLPHAQEIVIYNEANQTKSPMSLETYLIGVVAANMPVSYETETLKAQAVIARTYALKNITTLLKQNRNNVSFDSMKDYKYSTTELGLNYVEANTLKDCMEQGDYTTYLKNVETAVRTTSNEVITYKGELITPLFFKTSAGNTRNSKDVWDYNIPYLKSVDSKNDIQSSDYMKITVDTVSNVISQLNSAFHAKTLNSSNYDYQLNKDLPITTENFFDTVEVLKRDAYGYVLTISIGGVNTPGDAFANALGLNSSNFYIENYEGSVRFICNGKGHGIGFSQFGANELAKTGQTYTQLLHHYYTNVKIQPLNEVHLSD